jgi:hypothetical protein
VRTQWPSHGWIDVQRYASDIVLGRAPEFSTCATSFSHHMPPPTVLKVKHCHGNTTRQRPLLRVRCRAPGSPYASTAASDTRRHLLRRSLSLFKRYPGSACTADACESVVDPSSQTPPDTAIILCASGGKELTLINLSYPSPPQYPEIYSVPQPHSLSPRNSPSPTLAIPPESLEKLPRIICRTRNPPSVLCLAYSTTREMSLTSTGTISPRCAVLSRRQRNETHEIRLVRPRLKCYTPWLIP